MKYYIIFLNCKFCDIQECEVIKETPKTYTVQWDKTYPHIVKKSSMQFGDITPKLLCKTYEEALSKRRALLESKLKSKKERMKGILEDIQELEDFLKQGDKQ